jgi:Rrf2 family iron-sulfur cluster assembly transcriptional regulator
MKITAQEEYGIRLLLRIANCDSPEGISIPRLSEAEGLSQHYVAKLCRLLRMNGFIKSTRGKEGGYTLAQLPQEVSINQVLTILGGKLYSQEFCEKHSGLLPDCSRSCTCSVRSVWQLVQDAVDQVLDQYSLLDLMNLENGTKRSDLSTPKRMNDAKILDSQLSK